MALFALRRTKPVLAFSAAVVGTALLLGACQVGAACDADAAPSIPVANAPPPAPALPIEGCRVFVQLEDDAWTRVHNDRLHFCVFEHGDDDWIYVGVRHGLWSSGEFDLQVGRTTVFTGHVDHLLYRGVLLSMGDVLRSGVDRTSMRITRVTGLFK